VASSFKVEGDDGGARDEGGDGGGADGFDLRFGEDFVGEGVAVVVGEGLEDERVVGHRWGCDVKG